MKKETKDFSLELNYLKRTNGSYYYDLTPSKAFEKMDFEFLFAAFLKCLSELGLEFHDDDCLAINTMNFDKGIVPSFLESARQVLESA